MATPHSPAARPAADCEFLQGQKERNSSVHLVKRNVLPFIRETAGLCGDMKEWFTHPQAIQNVDEFVSSSDLEKCSIPSLARQWILCSEWVPSE